MPPDFPQLIQALPMSPPLTLSLRRFVDREALGSRSPPDYLYTTGYAYRVNTAAARALYGSEDAATAGTEWERQAKKSPRLLVQVLYFIDVSLPVIDLGNAAILAACNLVAGDLSEPWNIFPSITTRLQLFGDVVARQNRFGAVRFPSDAARERGFKGFNFVMFPTAIVAPMTVVIRDDTGKEIQRWPAPLSKFD